MTLKLIAVFAATVLSIGVMAADDPDATFKSLDRDADQRLSKTEVASDKMLSEHFAAADADSDGYLTKREHSAHMKEMMKSEPEKKEY